MVQNRKAKPPPTKTITQQEGKTSEPSEPIVAAHVTKEIDLDSLVPPQPGMEDLSTSRVLLVGGVLLAFGTLGFYWIEGLVEKDDDDVPRSHLVDSFYCAAITLTTVGFGDICPGNTGMVGKIFLLLFSFCGLGIFCGPCVQLASSWRHHVPGGLPALGSFTIGLGVTIFMSLEGLDHFESIYASVITGTTIGYGDVTPQTGLGKVAVALYAIFSNGAMAILLSPARGYLENLCRARSKAPTAKPSPTLKSTKQE